MQTKDRNRRQTAGKPGQPKKVTDGRSSMKPELQIQYTPAKPFNRNRFLLHLATIVAVVLALILGMSIFFKTGQVNVSGAQKYTPWEIKEASGIQTGDALMSLSEAKISAKIRAKLPYVGDVRVGIKLPDTVNIEIVELEVVYAISDNNSNWWLLDAGGRVVDTTDVAAAKDHTRILGVQIQDAVIGQQAVAAEQIPVQESQEATGVTVPTLPQTPATELLAKAVQLLTALENNGIMGAVESVDVSDSETLTLWYEDRYLVTLGDSSRLDYKIAAMKAAIKKMGAYQTGYLDVSFTIWSDEVGYRPFDGDSATKK